MHKGEELGEGRHTEAVWSDSSWTSVWERGPEKAPAGVGEMPRDGKQGCEGTEAHIMRDLTSLDLSSAEKVRGSLLVSL